MGRGRGGGRGHVLKVLEGPGVVKRRGGRGGGRGCSSEGEAQGGQFCFQASEGRTVKGTPIHIIFGAKIINVVKGPRRVDGPYCCCQCSVERIPSFLPSLMVVVDQDAADAEGGGGSEIMHTVVKQDKSRGGREGGRGGGRVWWAGGRVFFQE